MNFQKLFQYAKIDGQANTVVLSDSEHARVAAELELECLPPSYREYFKSFGQGEWDEGFVPFPPVSTLANMQDRTLSRFLKVRWPGCIIAGETQLDPKQFIPIAEFDQRIVLVWDRSTCTGQGEMQLVWIDIENDEASPAADTLFDFVNRCWVNGDARRHPVLGNAFYTSDRFIPWN